MKKFFIVLLATFIVYSPIHGMLFPDPTQLGQEIGKGLAQGLSEDLGSQLGANIGTALMDSTLCILRDAFLNNGAGFQALDNFLNALAHFYSPGGSGYRSIVNFSSALLRIGVPRGVIAIFSLVSAYYGTKLMWQYFEYYLKKPRLLLYISKPLKNTKKIKLNMIFSQALETQLNNIVHVTNHVNTLIKNGKKNIQYRNLLLYGSPGTGKTMFAKKLAQKSGMAFAFMTGASLFQFDTASAIKELDRLFQWAHKQNGLLLFIDEIEILLAKRESLKPDSAEYKILNHFLSLTGERSNKFMIVGATNKLNILDEAFERRFDDMIEIPLPTQTERIRVLDLYCNQVLCSKENDAHFVQTAKDCLTPDIIEQIALKTEGLSNGDLSGIINTLHTDALSSQVGVITPELIPAVVDRAIQKHTNFAKVHGLVPQMVTA